jgi:hypothetical protein
MRLPKKTREKMKCQFLHLWDKSKESAFCY